MGDKCLRGPQESDRKCYVFRLARLYGETPYPILRMTLSCLAPNPGRSPIYQDAW